MRVSRLFGLMAALSLSLALTANAFGAAAINSLLIPGVVNSFQDTDADRLLKGAGNLLPTIIEVGDILEAIISFDTANGTNVKVGMGSLGYELTGYTRLEVVSIAAAASGAIGRFDFVFKSGFADGVTTVELFEQDPGGNFTTSAAPAVGIASATDGSAVATIGFGKATDFWVSTDALLDVSLFKLLPAGAPQGGLFQFGQTVLANPGALPIDPLAMTGATGFQHDVIGNGILKKPAVTFNAGWDAESDTTAFFRVIPEPTSVLAWAGLAMVFAGTSVARRRKSN